MKLISADIRRIRITIFTILDALNFDLFGTFDVFKFEIAKKSEFKASKIVKMAVFDLLKSAKIDFT